MADIYILLCIAKASFNAVMFGSLQEVDVAVLLLEV